MKTRLLVAVAALALSAPALAANVVVNGSFETGNFTGWTQFGNPGFTGVVPGGEGVAPTDGLYLAAFGPVGSAGGISQTFAEAGTYNISFDLANFDGNSSLVTFGGITLLSNVATTGFGTYSFSIDAAAGSVLSFEFQNDPNYYYLDNVVANFTPTAVPEPASWAMLIAGFGLTGAAMRRRRVAVAA